MPATSINPDVTLARHWARRYVSMGFNPLPSCRHRKAPALVRGWTRYRTEPVPDKWPGNWWTPNIQIVTGVRWGLYVIDCDGATGLDVWRLLTLHRDDPPTWQSTSCGPDAADCCRGLHLWYSTPPGIDSLRSRKLFGIWEDTDWAKRSAIELLCDGSQVIAPPSLHCRTGRRYEWLPGHSPDDIARPAQVPAWILDLPEYTRPKPPRRAVVTPPCKAPVRPVAGRYDREAVLARIGDPAALAASWGLRLASERPNPAGWHACHAIGREDRSPSASISAATGCYWEPGERAISLFDLAVRLGAFPSWQDACDALGERYRATRSA